VDEFYDNSVAEPSVREKIFENLAIDTAKYIS